ncbi:MAG: tripartite tricarboxylate transporter substrate binding protein [Betaproteobacteria bacterium]
MRLLFSVVALLALAPHDIAAQGYPQRAITLINPSAAGGSNEALKAIILDRVAAALGVPIVMESRSGAGGTIAATYVAKSEPDGYTLFLAGTSVLATNPVARKDLPYDPVRDFTPIVMLIETSALLVTTKAVPATTAAEFVAWARSRPGKLNYGSYGSGSSNFLGFELFKQVTGTDLVNVPYRGSAPLLVALLSGQIDAAFEYPPTIRSHIDAGTFRVLGLASATRSRLFPDVPTLTEQGYPVEAGGVITLVAPAGLPASIADRLNVEVNKALALPEVRQRIADIGYEPMGGTREQAASRIASELAKWSRLARDIGLRPD